MIILTPNARTANPIIDILPKANRERGLNIQTTE